MSNKDILSKFFNEYFRKRISNSNLNNSKCKKSNYLKKYNLIYKENNILEFSPKSISKPNYNTFTEIKPYNLYEKKPFSNTLIFNYIQKKNSKKNLSLNINKNKIPNMNFFRKIEGKKLNNNENQNKTSSTCFNSKNHIKRIVKVIPEEKQEIKYILSKRLQEKINKDNKIEEEANKIVNHYISTDISKSKNYLENENKILDKVKKIKNKFDLDKKLLKMKNIKHKLMVSDYDNFKSINIQKMILGKEKNRKKLLKGIEDFYTNQNYRIINDNIIVKKGKNHFIENQKITNEFEFEENKFKLALSERIKKKNNLKNRINNNYKDFYSLSKARSHINKKDFMNFYEKLDCLKDRVKSTHKHIIKKIEIRQKFKENINNLFLV